MTTDSTLPPSAADCARFDAQLGPWLEHDLDPASQAFMTRHRASCAACNALANEIEGIVAQAGSLPPLVAPRALWAGIEARLETAVVPLPGTSAAIPRAPRTISVRTFAIAAGMLVAVSSGITWQVARTRGAAVAADSATRTIARGASGDTVATQTASPRRGTVVDLTIDASTDADPTANTQLLAGSPAATASRLSSVVNRDVDAAAPAATYEREIVALRRIVDERFSELDRSTVTELRRNIAIIDQAIADSRKALARDPRSALVSTQLDRALQAKLDLLRRVALL